MGIIKDKLDEQWADNLAAQADLRVLIKGIDDLLSVRDAVEKVYKDLKFCLERGAEFYPTGIVQFDTYISPIVADIQALKTKLETDYGEFLNWRKP